MNRTIIIAEAGVNHNGNLATAKKLIDAAQDAAVDYVKFQTFKAKNIASKTAEKAKYQQNSTNESQLEMLKQLELDELQHHELINYAEAKGVKFLSTAFDLESIDLLKKLDIKIGKIPSGEITNFPYLKKMAINFNEIILSSGMSTLQEIKEAIDVLLKYGSELENITVLHCNTEYPTPMHDVNLNAMNYIGKTLGVKIGYSDHTMGIEVPIAAVALGANLIEKHFTLDRNMDGPDHKASLEPLELKEMVNAIRNIEKALGEAVKEPSASETKNIVIARKSIVAATNIAQGSIFTEDNLTSKRPGIGINPMQWESILGKVAKRDFNADELIEI